MHEVGGYNRNPEEVRQRAPSQHRLFAADEIETLRARPEFGEAFLGAAQNAVRDYRGNRIFNRVFNDRGHWVVTWFAHYLHHFPLPGEERAGLTSSRLRKCCEEVGVCSGGRATAMLNVMRFAGYLRVAQQAGDRRQTVLVPTDKFVALRRQRLLGHFAGVMKAIPEMRSMVELLDDEAFLVNFIRHSSEGYMRGFRFTEHAPELAPYFEHSSASIILMVLLVQASRSGSGTAHASISALASDFWLSRGHVRNVLNAAVADGFIGRVYSSREPIVVFPALTDVMSRFFAGSFLYFARCMRLALRDLHDDARVKDSHARPPAN